ncbi:MAG: hypothetical protein GY922_06560 [Proteobacteria bacterium]|nr:hypothetical protein [Pseudomonadota bacterium]
MNPKKNRAKYLEIRARGNEQYADATTEARKVAYNFTLEEITQKTFGKSSKITPTDIDGCMDKNGYVMFLEFKTTGSGLSRGQEINRRALVNLNSNVWHVTIWHEIMYDDDGNREPFAPGLTNAVKIEVMTQGREVAVTDKVNDFYAWAVYLWGVNAKKRGGVHTGDGSYETFGDLLKKQGVDFDM